MPEMEKGRPPENKRSRKPAHPVKREINQEMKVGDAFTARAKVGDVSRGSTEDFFVRTQRLCRSSGVRTNQCCDGFFFFLLSFPSLPFSMRDLFLTLRQA